MSNHKKLDELKLDYSEKHLKIINKVLRKDIIGSIVLIFISFILIYFTISTHIINNETRSFDHRVFYALIALAFFAFVSIYYFYVSIQKKIAIKNGNIDLSYAIGQGLSLTKAHAGSFRYRFLIQEVSDNSILDLNYAIIGSNRWSQVYEKKGIKGLKTGTLKVISTTYEVHKTMSLQKNILLYIYNPNSVIIDFKLLD